MLAEIYRAATEFADGLVVIAGDVYDRLDLLPREKDLFVEHLCRADHAGITTIIVSGNHDMIDEDDGGYTHLRGLKIVAEERRLRRTYIVETNPRSFVPAAFPELSVICVPSYYRQTKEVNGIVQAQLKALKEAGDLHGTVLAVVHETVLGSKNDFGKRMGVDFGKAEHCVELDPSIPVTYWALGDIHRPQRIKGVQNAWYSGAPIQHDFGDPGDRGVLLVDLNKPTEPELLELEGVKKLVTVEVTARTKPEDLPVGAHVRLAGERDQCRRLQGHTAVVATKPVAPKEVEIIEDVKISDVLQGLPEILAEMGMGPEDQQWCLREADGLR
jgi:exonuclease SbcD